MTELQVEVLSEVVAVLLEIGYESDFLELPAEAYDPTTLKTIKGAETTHTHYTTPPYREKWDYTMSSTVFEDDVFIILANDSITFTPHLGLKVRTPKTTGDEYDIISIKRFWAGPTQCTAYKLQLRR